MAGRQAETVREVQEECGSEWNVAREQQPPCKCAARYDIPCRCAISHRFTRTALEDRPRPEWNREDARPVIHTGCAAV